MNVLATVDKFVAVKASDFNTFQQGTARTPQNIQFKALRIRTFQHVSATAEFWFGTGRSEIQILSPRFPQTISVTCL
jgi:hypothetical protein